LGNGSKSAEALPIVSLFAGAGGLDTGFHRAGFNTILAVDGNPAACQTFHHNYPAVPVIRKDLSAVDPRFLIERIEELPGSPKPIGVIGGPPCQAFSVGNGRKRADDPRASLSKQYALMISALNEAFALDFFVFENVTGLTLKMHRRQFSFFKQLFDSAGFWIFQGELNAYDFGVPQIRKRLFVVGLNKNKYRRPDFDFPDPMRGGSRTVRKAIAGLPAPKTFSSFRNGEGKIAFHPNHWCMTPRSEKFHNGILSEGQVQGRPFRVLAWDEPSWTVAYGHREVHVHPAGRRRLSVYEAMLLQGFPKNYELKGTLSDQFRLVSDAVPPPLAFALGRTIRKTIENLRSREGNRRGSAEHDIFWKARQSSIQLDVPPYLRDFFLKFSATHRRRFPWRKRSTLPFHLLLAELLLKQTKAADVAKIWPQLVSLYPTPHALSQAKKHELVYLLQMLGLQNQRASSLIKVAEALIDKFNGEIPTDMHSLLSLPGVGLYTAAAVCCFKFGKKVPVVDANVLRVFTRLTGDDHGADLRKSEDAWALAWAILPRRRSDRHNYAILDFAASVCGTPPKCDKCALRLHCDYAIRKDSK